MSDILPSQVIEPVPAPEPAATPAPVIDPKAAFVPTRDRIADQIGDYEKQKAALLSGGKPTIGWEPYPDADTAPKQPVPPPVATVAQPVAAPVVAPPPASVPDPQPAPVASPEPVEAPPVAETPPAPPEPSTKPIQSVELPPIPEELGVATIEEAEARTRQLRADLKQAIADYDNDKGEKILAEIEALDEARPLLSQHERAAQERYEAADREVVNLYPDAAKGDTAFGKRLVEVWNSWERTGHPAVGQIDGLMQAAHLVAREQAIAPASKIAAPAPAPTPAPVPPKSSLQTPRQTPPSPMAALVGHGTSPEPAAAKTFIEQLDSQMRTMDDYTAMKEKLLATGALR